VAEVEFGLLGPLLVRCGEVAVPLPVGKQRTLLGTMLLRANQAVSLPELTEALWGDMPPAAARKTLQNYVKRLRRALAVAGETRISTEPDGYLIRVADGELDVQRFEALHSSARRAARDGAWDQAAGQLRAALALWRGEPCADLQSDLLAQREVPRLAELRLQAVEARVDADLHLGRHADLTSELRQLAAVHPLRERLHALLMLALYRDGQQAAALAAYQRARRVLIDELGVAPGAELRQLEQQILNGDPALAAQAPVPRPPAGPPAETGPRGWVVVPRQLPAPARHFTGRTDELKALTGLLDGGGGEMPGTVLISAIGGTAGVGKTALAVRWAHQVADRFPDGQLYINLRGFDPSGTPVAPADAIRRFLEALQVPAGRLPATAEAQQDLYRSLLADRRMLIIADNARDAEQVRPLIPGGPACLIVVTSRGPLADLVVAEGAYPVTLDVLGPAECRELLARRIGAERIAAEQAAVTELTELCARLPLAVAIAAARAAMHPQLPLAVMVTQLRDAAGRLDALSAGAGAGASSVRAVFSWSYQQLGASAARMFRLLSVHPGPDVTAAAAASLAGISPDRARQVLGQLTDVNLLAEQAAGRFACHDLLRIYAAERAQAQDSGPARHAAARRMLDHYLHTARAAALLLQSGRDEMTLAPPQSGVTPEGIAGYDEAMAWLEAEHRVLLAAAGQAAEAGFDVHAWQLPMTLTTFFDRRGYWRSYPEAQVPALAAVQRLGDRDGLALVHQTLGHGCIQRGDYEDALAHYGQALMLCRQLGQRAAQGRAHTGLAFAFERQGQYRESLAHCDQALGLYEAIGDRMRQANTLNNIGWCHAQLQDYQQALACCERALTLHRELHDRHHEATTWDSLGYAHHHLGERAAAIACFEQALALFRDLGDRANEADILSHLGDAQDADGQRGAARDAWRQALAIFEDLRHPAADDIRARLAARGLAPAAD
jgi:DNA-binding SARP family transcriptional activator/Tfp pilus assembly protein PilF